MRAARILARIRGRDPDAGDTLVEILISVAILGIVGAALIGGFLTAITTSSDYRGVASADTVLRTAVDSVTTQMQQDPSAAFGCPEDSSIYNPTGLPSAYSSQVATLDYWVNGAAQTTCSAQASQLITLAVTYTNSAGKSSTNHATFAVNDPQAAPVQSGSVASKLVFLSTGGPSNSTAGSPIPTQPIVAIEDSSGHIVTTDLSAMTLSITPGTGATGATLKNCTGSEFYGVVNFTGCEIDVAGSGYTLTATDGSLTAASPTFTVSPGPAATLVFTQSPAQASPAGTDASAFTYEPIVTVQDAYGNTVTSDTSAMTLSITTGTGTTGASLKNCSANPLNASAGIAAFTGCGINKPGTGYTLTATDGSLNSATSAPTFTIAIGSPYSLVFTTEPVASAGGQAGTGGNAFATSGSSVGQQPVVTIEDAAGNTETSNTSTVNLSITSNTGTPGATLTCSPANDQQAASAGVATFSGCGIDKAGSGYTLTATDGTLIAATSTPAFSIGVGPAHKLAFTTQPVSSAGAQAGTDAGSFTQQPVVTIEDAGGNTVTSNTSTVTLAITSGTGTSGASLSCTTNPLAATAGVATFSGCGINKPGSGYTLAATDGTFTSATSIAFSIGTGPATKLIFTQSPVNSSGSQAGTGGIAWSQQPVVTIEDAKGYTVTSNTSSVTLAITSGTGASGATLTCTPNPEAASAGVATFSGCAINTAASGYTLTATDGLLTSATSLSFKIAVGPAAQLVFSTEPPSSATKNTYFSTSVTVEDAGGNAVASSSVSLSITSGTGKSNATLTCTTNPITSNSSGVAGFSCEINKDSPTSPSNPYTLTATDGSATGTSSSFTVTG